MCVFMYKGIITPPLLSFLQYKFGSELELRVRRGGAVLIMWSVFSLKEEEQQSERLSARFSCPLEEEKDQ